MKRIVLAFLCLLLTSRLFASHIAGGELRYEFNGKNYTVIFKYYLTCGTIAVPDSVLLSLNSTSCGASISKYLQLNQADTLLDAGCSSVFNCGGPGTQAYIIYTYSDTISLSKCSDWIMNVDISSYTAVDNIGPGDLYLDAFLDNSSSDNSNVLNGNGPVFYLPENTTNKVPIENIDYDGDSVVTTMMTPLAGSGTTLTYNMGYSFASPLGAGSSTIVDPSSQILYITTPKSIGKYLLASQTNEYRAGKLVGYSMRSWVCNALSTTLFPPLPQAGDTFVRTTCPGKADSISLSFYDSVSYDTLTINFMPTNSWSYSTSTTISPVVSLSSASGTIKWTTPATLDPSVTPYFYINVEVYNKSCPLRGISYYTILVKTQACNTDSVWPGDANDDKIANLYDALAVAVAYGNTGTARISPTTSWVGQYCPNWSGYFISTVNMKYADCDGNGTVDSSDLLPILANYGDVHHKGILEKTERIAGLPNLYFDLTGITFAPGATVSVPIKLGDAAIGMNNIYGLATSINISGITLKTPPAITYPSSWLGTSANTLHLAKVINDNKIDWTYARIDHNNISGNGTLATLTFTIPATATPGNVIFSTQGSRIINKNGTPQTGYNTLRDTGIIKTTAIAALNIPVEYAIINPNPSSALANLTVSLNKSSSYQVKITDVVGRIIWQHSETNQAGNQNIMLPAANLTPGMYLVHITGEGWQYPLVLKWIKE